MASTRGTCPAQAQVRGTLCARIDKYLYIEVKSA